VPNLGGFFCFALHFCLSRRSLLVGGKMSVHILVQGQRKEARAFGTYDSVVTDCSRPRQCCPGDLHARRYLRTIGRPNSQEYFSLPFLLFGYAVFPITVESMFGAKPRSMIRGNTDLHRSKQRRSSARRFGRNIFCWLLHFFLFRRSL
jgi:hypothetical protein